MLLSLAICRTRSSVQQFGPGFFEKQRAMQDSETGAESYLDFGLGFGASAGLVLRPRPSLNALASFSSC